MKFDIISEMILPMNLKRVFNSLPTSNANISITNFVGIFRSYEIRSVNQDVIKPWIFNSH